MYIKIAIESDEKWFLFERLHVVQRQDKIILGRHLQMDEHYISG
jgi:hypothetical protein